LFDNFSHVFSGYAYSERWETKVFRNKVQIYSDINGSQRLLNILKELPKEQRDVVVL